MWTLGVFGGRHCSRMRAGDILIGAPVWRVLVWHVYGVFISRNYAESFLFFLCWISGMRRRTYLLCRRSPSLRPLGVPMFRRKMRIAWQRR